MFTCPDCPPHPWFLPTLGYLHGVSGGAAAPALSHLRYATLDLFGDMLLACPPRVVADPQEGHLEAPKHDPHDQDVAELHAAQVQQRREDAEDGHAVLQEALDEDVEVLECQRASNGREDTHSRERGSTPCDSSRASH